MNIDLVYDKSVFFAREERRRFNEQHPDEYRIISNHSGYGCEGGENFEHDDTGCLHNYSGVEDDIFSSYAEHEDWQEGYDY